MKTLIGNKSFYLGLFLYLGLVQSANAEDENLRIIRQSLLGAGVGAISAEASGGKAGTGAWVGAGTQVIGNALMGILTEGSGTQRTYPAYSTAPNYSYSPISAPAPATQTRRAPRGSSPHNVTYVPVQITQPVYIYETEPVYVQQAPVYYAPSPRHAASAYQDPNRRIIHQGLIGAGVGAISSYASGGKAGKGALIGAGSNVIGTALLEILTTR